MKKVLLKTNENFSIKKELIKLARQVRKAVLPRLNSNNREIIRRQYCGDPHFMLDEIAEKTVEKILKKWKLPIAYFSEDRGLVYLHKKPKHILIIDPIDGTRPAMANFENCCFSIAVAPYSEHPMFGEITNALVLELKSGEYFYADISQPNIAASILKLPLLNRKISLENMFWSTELTAHPIKQITRVCGDLIDNSVTLGAVFVFTSSSYSLTRIVTGQLDAHVDVGHRILQDNSELTEEFLKVGRGKVVTLFPYDIAAAAFILIKAGGIVTDAYGQPLDKLPLLTNKSVKEQCSIIAASNQELHEKIKNQLKW
jgi:myo-inositol-1(or 4)-monophosphatase